MSKIKHSVTKKKVPVFAKKLQVNKILSLLKTYYPNASCSLHYDNPLQLLIATMLSAQCTDKRVNEVTKILFKKYSTVQKFANVPQKILEHDIRSTGFFKNKAKNIRMATQKIKDDFNGNVPKTLEQLTSLPGVGRKTAHVVLGNAFHIADGVVVDTHVKRLSYRLGFTKHADPAKIEKDLCSLLPNAYWIYFSHAIILHGRNQCKARVPKCNTCFLEGHCPKRGVKKKN